MIRPYELTLDLPMEVGGGMIARTGEVWEVLSASAAGDLKAVKQLVARRAGLAYAQYNYAPPIHFAVREGHVALVEYLLDLGAHDPTYRIYPFLDSLETIAAERGQTAIEKMLKAYGLTPEKHKYKGDNGRIMYTRTEETLLFEQAVTNGDLQQVQSLLDRFQALVHDRTLNWSEGILAVPANKNDLAMASLLLERGATVPTMLKWAPAYHFKHYEMASLLIHSGMDPQTKSWQSVTLLHNMAQKGDLPKAGLLLDHDADIDAIDQAYQSTPLGLAAKWGQREMVRFLLDRGADRQKAGASFALPARWAAGKGYPDIEKLLKV